MQKKTNPDYVQEEQNMNRNQNILMAVLSLMRELDPGSLEIVRREADRMLEWFFLFQLVFLKIFKIKNIDIFILSN